MTKMEKGFCFIVFLLAAALSFNYSSAYGQKAVSVRVRLILASNEPGFSGASPELNDIAGNLGSLFKYKGYKLLKSSTRSVSPGKPATMSLPYGTKLEISSAGGGKNERSLSVRWLQTQRGEIVSTQVRLRGRNPVLIGGPSVKDGVLIIALSLR